MVRCLPPQKNKLRGCEAKPPKGGEDYSILQSGPPPAPEKGYAHQQEGC